MTWFKRKAKPSRPTEAFWPKRVEFVGEQVGPVEDDLKARFGKIFTGTLSMNCPPLGHRRRLLSVVAGRRVVTVRHRVIGPEPHGGGFLARARPSRSVGLRAGPIASGTVWAGEGPAHGRCDVGRVCRLLRPAGSAAATDAA